MLCKKPNTRMILTGDPQQCLYAFSSADPESFKKLKAMPDTTTLPLPISYRCAYAVVKCAQAIVPDIEPSDDGRMGKIMYAVDIDELRDGDMVVCRNNAPLMQLYIDLIGDGKKCFILGKDIGKDLIKVVERTKMEDLNVALDRNGVFVSLYSDLISSVHDMKDKHNITIGDALDNSFIEHEIDRIMALEVLSKGINTAEELKGRINDIFSDTQKSGIQLSTVHKAKGLEADRVFILCKELMPSKSATKDWEIEQEQNIIYVAYTRAKNVLGFINEKKYNVFLSNGENGEKWFTDIENRVKHTLYNNMTPSMLKDDKVRKRVIDNATVIDATPFTMKRLVLGEQNENAKRVSLNEMFGQKKAKKKKIRSI